MRWLMDLRGEKDVIGWLSLPAVERDAAQHLQHRATERKRRRPSARKSLFHHHRLSTAENSSCRGEIMITAHSTSWLFIAGEHLLPRQNIGIHPSIPLQHTLFGKALHSSGWVLPEEYILHLPCQLAFHFFSPPIWFSEASEILKNYIFVPIHTQHNLVFSPCTGFRCCKQNRHVIKHNRYEGGITCYFTHKAEKCKPWKCNLDNPRPEARNDARMCEMKRRQWQLM